MTWFSQASHVVLKLERADSRRRVLAGGACRLLLNGHRIPSWWPPELVWICTCEFLATNVLL